MSSPTEAIPVFDMSDFIAGKECPETCKQMAEYMAKTGILVIRDPRATEERNNSFIDMMERYFSQPETEKMKDVRKELHYQVGATPGHTERCRCSQEEDCIARISQMPEEHRPHIPTKPDPKWRFFWRMGEPPAETKFPALNAAPVLPAAFPEWRETMNSWGEIMLTAVSDCARMLSTGLGLGRDSFVDRMKFGPHLLAPTGTDLSEYGDLHTIMAGYHTDLSFLTIHGKSRYPGLYVWLRSGERMLVRIPDGCLLVQAGSQLEWLTGGYIEAGYHEVVVTPETEASLKKAKEEGRCLWRVSSTLFSHIGSDVTLEPLGDYSKQPNASKYPPTLAGDQVIKELEFIKLQK